MQQAVVDVWRTPRTEQRMALEVTSSSNNCQCRSTPAPLPACVLIAETTGTTSSKRCVRGIMGRHHSGLDLSSLIADWVRCMSTKAGLLAAGAGGAASARAARGILISRTRHKPATGLLGIVPAWISCTTRRLRAPKTFLGMVPCRRLVMNCHKGYWMHGVGAVVNYDEGLSPVVDDPCLRFPVLFRVATTTGTSRYVVTV
jgi:hypothetical protein